MSESAKNFIEEMKRKPAKAVMLGIIAVLLIFFVVKNVLPGAASVSGAANATPQSMDAKVTRILDLLAQIQQRQPAFERVQRRGGSFIVVDSRTEVGIAVQDAVRGIAQSVGMNINVGTYNISPLSDSMQTCTVPFNGGAPWPHLLEFLSEVEVSLPNFVWSNFSLSTRERDKNIYFTCSLKIVIVKDPEFINVLEPIHETIRENYAKTFKRPGSDPGLQQFGDKLDTGMKTATVVTVPDDFDELDDEDFEWDDMPDTAVKTPPAKPAADTPVVAPSAPITIDTKPMPTASDTVSSPSPAPAEGSGFASPPRTRPTLNSVTSEAKPIQPKAVTPAPKSEPEEDDE